MTEKIFTAKFIECTQDELEQKDKDLVESAKSFLDNAYSPYSKFNVSCALVLDNGKIINGTNQENAAYPSGTCAERTTIFYANSMYPNSRVETMAIVAKTNGKILEIPITPCGACRQVILESQIRQKSPIKIILVGTKKCFIINSITDLLPLSFDDSFLN